MTNNRNNDHAVTVSRPDYPMQVTVSGNQIIITGFYGYQFMNEFDCIDNEHLPGDIQLTDSDGDIIGYVMIGG